MCRGISIEPMKVARGFVDHIEHNAKRCAFSAPVRTEKSINVPFFNGEGKVVNSRNGAKPLSEVFYGKYMTQKF